MDIRTSGDDGAGLHVSFRTTCGREIRIGHLILGGGRRLGPARQHRHQRLVSYRGWHLGRAHSR